MSPSPAGATSSPRPLAGIGKDFRVAVRRLAKDRGFTLTAILTLALATGATTAVFTLVNAVLLRPLAYRAPEQLVRLYDVQQDVPEGLGVGPGCPRLGARARTLPVSRSSPRPTRASPATVSRCGCLAQRMNAGALPGARASAAPRPRVRRGRGPRRWAGGGDARRALLAQALRRPPGDRGEHLRLDGRDHAVMGSPASSPTGSATPTSGFRCRSIAPFSPRGAPTSSSPSPGSRPGRRWPRRRRSSGCRR